MPPTRLNKWMAKTPRRVARNPRPYTPSAPFNPADWAAHSNEFLVESYLDILTLGDPTGEGRHLAAEVTRRGLEALAGARALHRREPA